MTKTANTTSILNLKLENISRKNLDAFARAVNHALYQKSADVRFISLYDLTSTGIILTPYVERIFSKLLEPVLISPDNRIAIVVGTDVLGARLQSFLESTIPTHTASAIRIFRNEAQAIQWLNSQ